MGAMKITLQLATLSSDRSLMATITVDGHERTFDATSWDRLTWELRADWLDFVERTNRNGEGAIR